jgi:hypothetical protein
MQKNLIRAFYAIVILGSLVLGLVDNSVWWITTAIMFGAGFGSRYTKFCPLDKLLVLFKVKQKCDC